MAKKSWIKQFQSDGKQRHRRPSSSQRNTYRDKLQREKGDKK